MNNTYLDNKIKLTAETFKKNKRAAGCAALSIRNYLAFYATKEPGYLQQAYQVNASGLSVNTGNLSLYYLSIFYNIELGNLDKAKGLMDNLKPYRNSFKAHSPFDYGVTLFFQSLYESEKEKFFVRKKGLTQLLAFNDEKDVKDLDVLIAALFVKYEDYDRAAEYAAYACLKESRSVFLYIVLAEIFNRAEKLYECLYPVVNVFLRWAFVNGIDMSLFIEKQAHLLPQFFTEDIWVYLDIYKKWKLDPLLGGLCQYFISQGDLSESSLELYREADAKQYEIPYLNEYLIKAAYKNKSENLTRFNLARYIQDYGVEIDFNLKPFVYHLLLLYGGTLPNKVEDQIKQFSVYCIENRFIGRYYNTLYKYVIEKLSNDKACSAYVESAQDIILQTLFDYEIFISDKRVKSFWVYEKEKKQMGKYEVENGKTKIRAVSDEFTYYCLDKNMSLLPNPTKTEIKIVKMVENAGIGLYTRFFNKNVLSTELLIILSNYYLGLEGIKGDAIDIFKRASGDPQISRKLKNKLMAALGYAYATDGDDLKAVSCFREVDENDLEDVFIDRMLVSLVNTKNYRQAVNLVFKKTECISERSLFYALKQISKQEIYDAEIVNAAYELILKSRYDKALLKIVLEHYNGSLEEWEALAQSLAAMSVSELSLDEIILNDAVFMHKPDKGVLKIFLRMAELKHESPICNDFAMYLAYEAIINDMKLPFEVIDALEKLYLKNQEKFLAFALCVNYTNHKIITAHSNYITKKALAVCEEEEIIFSAFKQIKDKNILTPYIEKNQPFIYRSHPDRKVFVYYKTDSGDYLRKEMKYVKFGLYMSAIPHFYGEGIKYYFSEEMPSGSIVTKEAEIGNNKMTILQEASDPFYIINNALVYEQMFKYDRVEEIITEKLQDRQRIKGWII